MCGIVGVIAKTDAAPRLLAHHAAVVKGTDVDQPRATSPRP